MARPARLTRHLEDPERVRELRAIEAGLTEHPFPPQLVVENTSYCNLKGTRPFWYQRTGRT